MIHPTQSLWLLIIAGIFAAFVTSASADSLELVKNGKFQAHLSGWQIESPEGSGVTSEIQEGPSGDKAIVIAIPSATKHTYDVKLVQPVYRAPQSKPFKLTFRARGEGTISVSLREIGGAWKILWTEPVKLSTDWAEYSFNIPAQEWPVAMRLDFGDLGGKPRECGFADISLQSN